MILNRRGSIVGTNNGVCNVTMRQMVEETIEDKYALGKYTTPKEQVIARLKANGLLLLPTITDDTNKLVLANLLANPTSRTNIVQSIKALVLK